MCVWWWGEGGGGGGGASLMGASPCLHHLLTVMLLRMEVLKKTRVFYTMLILDDYLSGEDVGPRT